MRKIRPVGFLTAVFLIASSIVLFGQIAAAQTAIKQRDASIPSSAAGTLTGMLFIPATPGPAPAVLILHTAGGLSDAERGYARDLAQSGFVALTVNYQIGWVAKMNEGLAEAVDWLRKQPESRDMPVGIVGFSLGASKALLVAALRPAAVKAVIAYYATYNVDISKFKDVARQARDKLGLATPSPVQVVGKINAAILLLQGEKDDETAPNQTEQMKAALDKAKKSYELKIYPGAVHMFEREAQYHPPGSRTRFGTITGYDGEAAKDSWQKSVDWLKRHLRPAPG